MGRLKVLHSLALAASILFLCFPRLSILHAQVPQALEARRMAETGSAVLNAPSGAPGYCPSVGGNTAFESIKRVTWTFSGNTIRFIVELSIDNPTGCTAGQPCPEYDNSPEFVNAWIDWNGDKTWQPSERVLDLALTGYLSINYRGTMTGTGQATIPNTHVDKPWMRVNLGWGFDPNDPCIELWEWGDVNDMQVELPIYNVDRLLVAGGNRVREIADDIIWLQPFGAGCSLVDSRVDFRQYPFSAPRASTVRLQSRVARCPTNGTNPEVTAKWKIGGTSLQGTSTWTGYEGEVAITTPDVIGDYTVQIEYLIKGDGQKKVTLTRKLFVTKTTPLAQVNPPKREWYERATDWGKGQKDDGPIFTQLLAKEYAFGGANWLYAYRVVPGIIKCNWQQLVADPITCNYSDCYVFSDVFENMAATLGVGGLAAVAVYGSSSNGFVTTGAPSLDPAFPGSARPRGGGAYNRYVFSSHSLRRKGAAPPFYDATFNGSYPADNTFISWNKTGAMDATSTYYVTTEGAKVYRIPGNSYDAWGNWEYSPPGVPKMDEPAIASAARLNGAAAFLRKAANGARFTGEVDFHLVDENADGTAEALLTSIGIEITETGEYLVSGRLLKNGEIIADRPSFEVMTFSDATISGEPGVHAIDLHFSGEQIFQSGQNGPYELSLTMVDYDGAVDQLTVATPAYGASQFGELGAAIVASTDEGVDSNADGLFDHLEVTVEVDTRIAGTYLLQGALMHDETVIHHDGGSFAFETGQNLAVIRFDGRKIRRHGIDGPYLLVLTILDENAANLGSREFATQAYSASDFALAVLEPTGTYFDVGLDLEGTGFFDGLRITMEATSTEAGAFSVAAALGHPVTEEYFTSTTAVVALGVGTNDIVLDFPGRPIHAYGEDGPYRLERVQVLDEDGKVIDEFETGYLTSFYQFTDFDPFVQITLSESVFDLAVDHDANAHFDELVVTIEVTSNLDGNVIAIADLYDPDGRRLISGEGLVELTANVPAPLPISFSGPHVYAALSDGPLQVRNLFVFPTGDIDQGLTVEHLHTTASYSYQDFEPAGVVKGIVQQPTNPFAFAAGSQLFLGNTFDFAEEDGFYRLIFTQSVAGMLNAVHPTDPDAEWRVFVDGELIGQQRHADISAGPGDVVNVDFLATQPLAMHLTAFRSVQQDEDILLFWTIENNANVDGFEVEARHESTLFASLGYVEGDAASMSGEYSFRWKRPGPGRMMFRLKQIERNGTISFSHEFEHFVELATAFVLEQAYPNPFNPTATVRFAVRESVPVKITLFDAIGRQVRLLYDDVPDAHMMHDVGIDGNGLASGSYLLQLTGPGIRAQQRIVLAK